MIRLNLPREPYWLDMPSGVRVLVRPLTTAVNETAKARMRRRTRELGEHRREIEASGGRVSDLPDLADVDGVIGVGFALYAEALAVSGVIGWEGVGDDDGEPLDVTPDAVSTWMASFPGDADAFVIAYTGPVNRAVAEGKRLKALAAWHFGDGREYCQGCRDNGDACAEGEAIDGALCPYVENCPLSEEGAEAWDILTRCHGPLRHAGMAAVPVGLDLPAGLTMGEALGYDRLALAHLLSMAESAVVLAIHEKLKSNGD